MVSFDVSSLFTNVPLLETINIITNKVYNSPSTLPLLTVNKETFKELLTLASSDSFFLFNETIYQQIDGVAMGSPLGPTLANLFLNHLEDRFYQAPVTPIFYRRYVD